MGILFSTIGLFQGTDTYLINLIAKEELKSYERILNFLTTISLIKSISSIFITILMNKWLVNLRISPITIILIPALISFILTIICLIEKSLNSFTLLTVFAYLVRRNFIPMAFKNIENFLAIEIRGQIKVLKKIFMKIIPIIIATIFISLIEFYIPEAVIWGPLTGLILVFGIMLITLPIIRSELSQILVSLSRNDELETSIRSIYGLSYLKPPNISTNLENIFYRSSDNNLKKQIALTLGYLNKNDNIEKIKKIYSSENEEIQVAFLSSLEHNPNYFASNFILNSVIQPAIKSSMQARNNAAKMIGNIFGKKAIPFLLNGLNSNNQRVIANTLEILSIFKSIDLIPIFQKYAYEGTNRIQANAMIGLIHFRKHKKEIENRITSYLYSNNSHMKRSILFICGKMPSPKIRRLLKKHKLTLKKGKNYLPVLAWALVNNDIEDGYEIMLEELVFSASNELNSSILHFFAKLPSKKRFHLVDLAFTRTDTDQSEKLIKMMKKSKYAFIDEIKYLQNLHYIK